MTILTVSSHLPIEDLSVLKALIVELRSPTFIIRMLDLAIAATITSLEFSSFEIHKVIRSCTDAYLDIGQPL